MTSKGKQRKTVTGFVASMRGYEYVPCQGTDIPADVRWTTPRRNQGQIVTVSYGGHGTGDMGEGDPYMHRVDASLPWGHQDREEYFRLVAKE